MATLTYIASALLIVFHVSSGVKPPSGFDTNFCKPSDDSGGKDFPTIADDYYAKIEWNDRVARQTYFLEEFVSHPLNRGAIYVTGYFAPDVTSHYITSADTAEFITIYDRSRMEFEDGNCVVSALSKQEFALPVVKDPKDPTKLILASGESLLFLGASPVGKSRYNGTTEVNGIPCDKWQGCLFLEDGKVTINVEFYFSLDDPNGKWFMAGGPGTAPVLITVKGKAGDDKTILDQAFNYIYYSSSWPSVNPESFARVFEPPEHALCPGKKGGKPLPNVPDHFGFRAEIVDNINKNVLFTREWYDFTSNYSRMDFKSPPTGNITVDRTVSPKKIINDFNTGVSYLIDQQSGECIALPIIGGEFDSVGLGNGFVRMRTPKEFFDFDNDKKYPYQYMGEHVVRGVLSDGWISWRPYPNEASDVNATWEWYFVKNDTVYKAQDLVENLEPLQATVKSTEANVDMTYNIYRFTEHAPDSRIFDVSACFIDSGSLSFDMQLTGNWSGFNAGNQLQSFDFWFKVAVEAFAGIRIIRIQDTDYEFTGNNVAVRFTILGPAPLQGDVQNNIKQATLEEVRDRIVESFESGEFEVFFQVDPLAGTAQFKAVPGTLRVIEGKEDSKAYRPTNSPLKGGVTEMGPGLTGGAATGLAFGMLFLGIILAIVAIFVYNKVRTPSTTYARQRNNTRGEEEGN